jgi:hypothetical protein
MSYSLQQSINFASTFIEYSPLTAGIGFEPANGIASEIKNTIMNPLLTWGWNRAEDSSLSTVAGTQDYTVNLTDFGFLEKVSLTDPTGAVFEMADVQNTFSLGKADATVPKRARPNAVCVLLVTYGTSVRLRFMGIPDVVYNVTLTYQKLVNLFTPFSITSSGNASPASLVLTQVTVSGASTTYTGTITGGAANAFVGMTFTITGFANAGNNLVFTVTASTATTLVGVTTTQVNETHAGAAAGGQMALTGIFTPTSLPAGAVVVISGFVTNPGNNGSFVVVSVTPTTLVVVNPAGLAETIAATASIANWDPIPDHYIDIFNNLFLAESMTMVDDARAVQYRQRGITALLAKAEGLSEMQRNAFLDQYWTRDSQQMSRTLRTQQGNQSRGA